MMHKDRGEAKVSAPQIRREKSFSFVVVRLRSRYGECALCIRSREDTLVVQVDPSRGRLVVECKAKHYHRSLSS